MVNDQLLGYIKQQLAQGISQDIIKNNLISGGGWSLPDINEAFSRIGMASSPIPPVVPQAPIATYTIKTKRTGSWILYAVIAVIVLLVIGGGYYLFTKNNSSSPAVTTIPSATLLRDQNAQNTQLNTAVKTNTTVTPSDSNTKKYNQVNNFYSFKYPNGSVINPDKVLLMSSNGSFFPVPDGGNPLLYSNMADKNAAYQPAVSIQLKNSSLNTTANMIFFIDRNGSVTNYMLNSGIATKASFGSIDGFSVNKYVPPPSMNKGQALYEINLGQFGTSTESLLVVTDENGVPSLARTTSVETIIRSIIPNTSALSAYISAYNKGN